MATELPNQGSLDKAVTMQENSSRHLTNCVSADLLADVLDEDIVLFSCHVSRNEINGQKIIRRDEIYGELDGKNITEPGLLLFWKGMPAAMLSNSCTMHKIVNKTKTKMYSAVANLLSMSAS